MSANTDFKTKKNILSLLLPVMLLGTSQTSQAMELVPTIEDAIVHNPIYREQIKVYQGAEADLEGAEGDWYPTVDLEAGIGNEKIERENSTTDLTRREASIAVTENLFKGFRTESEIDRHQARLDAAIYSAEAAANQVALSMSEAFLSLLREQELLKLEEESVKTHERILDQIVQRSEAGIGNQVEVDQAKARLALATSNYLAAQNNYQDTRALFQRTLGRMPDNNLISPELVFEVPESIDEAVKIALINNPTLRSANADIAEAQAQNRTSKSAFYPTLDLELRKTFDENINGVEGKNYNTQAMLRMRYNIYNGGKDSARLDSTSIAVQQAAEIRNNARRQTIENLRYALNAKKYISSQLIHVKEHIKLTYETLEGYRKQFSLGRRSLLDLLNTEDEYNNALRTLVESEADYQIAQMRILEGMGTLIDTLGVNVKFSEVETDYSNK